MIPPSLARDVLDALPQALSVLDAEGRLVYVNAAFWALADVDPAACPIGSSLRDLVRVLAYRGHYGPGDPEALAEGVLRIDRTRPFSRLIRSADGTDSFEISSIPLPGGGFLNAGHRITELVRGREEAQERARLMETVLGALRGGIIAYDSETRVNLVNPAVEALTGLPPGSIRPGMTHHDILALQQARGEFANVDARTEIAERIQRDRSVRSTRQRQRPNGTVLRFDSHPLPEGGFVVEVDDITALKRAEDEARRRATLLDGVLEALPHGVAVFGPDRRVTMFNAAYRRLFTGEATRIGEKVDDLIARRVAAGEYDARVAEQVLLRFSGTPEGAAARAVALRRVRPDGTVTENRMARLPDGGIISVFTDVSALHQAEGAARERATMLDAVIEAMPNGICVYGPDRRVTVVNAAYGRIMGGAAAKVGEGLEELVQRRIAAGEVTAERAAMVLRKQFSDTPDPDEMLWRVRPNGTAITTRIRKLPDGGFLSVVTDVTALHEAEMASSARAAMLDAVLQSLPDGVVVYDAERRARMTNSAYRRLMGPAAARLGESLDDLAERRVAAGEMTREMANALLARHFGAVAEVGEPMERARPDGTVIASRTGRLPDGGHIAVITDITALRRAEEELRRRAAILEATFGAMRHGMVVFGPDHRLLAWNDQVSDLSGLPPENLKIGMPLAEMAAAQVARGILTPEQGHATAMRDRSVSHRMSRGHIDGRTLEILSDPTPDGGFVVSFTDITPLLRAEREARRHAAMLEAMLGNIRHGIILYGPDRRVLATNARTAELTGMPAESLVPGRLMDDLIDEQVLRGQMSPAAAASMKAADRRQPQRYSRARPDGHVLEISSEPTPDGGYVITYSDVTDDRRIRAELEGARAAAEAGSAAKSRFLATMSHELRTPLNAVIGFSEAIASERDRARIEDYAAAVNEAGRQLLGLIDDILDVARSQTGALSIAEEPVALAPLLQASMRAATPAAQAAGLTLELALPEELPALRGDARRLGQVLDKLLSNAIKFTPAEGRVTLSAELDAEGLAIRVRDTGIGIPPEDRERSFEPFTQLDASLSRRFPGSGLGLHLARHLAQALGGQLTLEDPEGPGLVALLRFPASRLAHPANA